MPSPKEDAIRFLLASQLISGGWGYELRSPAVVESTAAVVLALRHVPEVAQSLKRAVEWLLTCQNEDGGWGYNQDDTESNWLTAWAVFALRQAGFGDPESERGIHWLISEKVLQYTDSSLLSEGTKIARIDFSIRGWPWQPTEASWVEPTALAILALERAREQPDVRERLDEAIRYLKDRRVPGGGWNVGNPVMFSSILPARAHPTAWALLALKTLSEEAILPEDLSILQDEMHRDGGVMGLGWGLLVLRRLGKDDHFAEKLLVNLQQADGSWDQNPYLTAVALMSLEGDL